MSVSMEPAVCWIVGGEDDERPHFPNRATADAFAAQLEPEDDREVRELDAACVVAVCDSCGVVHDEYGDGPIHYASLRAARGAIDASGWTIDPETEITHCPECPPLASTPLAAARYPADDDLPIIGL